MREGGCWDGAEQAGDSGAEFGDAVEEHEENDEAHENGVFMFFEERLFWEDDVGLLFLLARDGRRRGRSVCIVRQGFVPLQLFFFLLMLLLFIVRRRRFILL